MKAFGSVYQSVAVAKGQTIPNSVWATIHNGQIELAEAMDLPEGAKVLVIVLPDEEAKFWQDASDSSLAGIWDNTEDDVYAQLLDQ